LLLHLVDALLDGVLAEEFVDEDRLVPADTVLRESVRSARRF
jgi:hypothetical protein